MVERTLLGLVSYLAMATILKLDTNANSDKIAEFLAKETSISLEQICDALRRLEARRYIREKPLMREPARDVKVYIVTETGLQAMQKTDPYVAVAKQLGDRLRVIDQS